MGSEALKASYSRKESNSSRLTLHSPKTSLTSTQPTLVGHRNDEQLSGSFLPALGKCAPASDIPSLPGSNASLLCD